MILIRLTFKNKKKLFVKENRDRLEIVENIKDAFQYRGTLEFKVSWKLMKTPDAFWNKKDSWDKEDVVKFEYIDPYTLESKKFDVKENEIEIGKTLYVDSYTFRRLMSCGITSSHWLYDKKDNWISFPKAEDYAKIKKIKYYNRGLTDTIYSHNNWCDRYDEHSWHGCYEAHHKCMLNPIIQQICLLNFDSCHEFNIYEKKLVK